MPYGVRCYLTFLSLGRGKNEDESEESLLIETLPPNKSRRLPESCIFTPLLFLNKIDASLKTQYKYGCTVNIQFLNR